MKRPLAAVAALWMLALGSAAQTPTAGGEVVKLDKPAGRITLKHAGIQQIDMPPMTMAFRVREGRLLDDVAVGDRVRFVVEKIDGQYTVVALSKAP